MKLLVDTGPLQALAYPRDQFRQRTLRLMRELASHSPKLFTTDYIIDEAFTGLISRTQAGVYRVKALDNNLFMKQMCEIIWIDRPIFAQARKLLLKVTKDKTWSFTDCTSYVVISKHKLDGVITFDKHFKQMGFKVIG